MRPYWLKLILLATFAFWATGTAKFVHEAMEHHGHDASVDGDDDDDDCIAVAFTVPASNLPSPLKQAPGPKHKHPCPVCQMLAAMAIEKSTPSTSLIPTLDLVAVVVAPDWHAPVVRRQLALLPTGPPVIS